MKPRLCARTAASTRWAMGAAVVPDEGVTFTPLAREAEYCGRSRPEEQTCSHFRLGAVSTTSKKALEAGPGLRSVLPSYSSREKNAACRASGAGGGRERV